MYHAKRLGGDRIEVFRTSLRRYSAGDGVLENDLQRALERNEIRVLYQPIVRARDERIVGFEALAHGTTARPHPDGGIHLARRAHRSSSALGLMVLEKAARQLSQWQAQGHPRSAAVRLGQRLQPGGSSATI